MGDKLLKIDEKRLDEGADIQLRKERLHQFLQIIQSRDIILRQYGPPPRFPLTAASFQEASPKFVSYVIAEILPGTVVQFIKTNQFFYLRRRRTFGLLFEFSRRSTLPISR